MLSLDLLPSHNTASLFPCEVPSCRQKMQQLCLTRRPFIFSGTAASLDFFFSFFFCGFKSPLPGLVNIFEIKKKKIYIAFRKIIPGVYYGTVSSRFLPCDVEAALLQFLDAPYPHPLPTMAIIYISSYWILYEIKPLVLASCSLPSIKQNEKSNP